MESVVIQKKKIYIRSLLRCHCCFDQYFALLQISRCGVWLYKALILLIQALLVGDSFLGLPFCN